MKREDWRRAYEPLPQALETRVAATLARLDPEEKYARRPSLRTAVIVLAILLALGGVAYAVLESKVADVFGWFYGPEMKDELLAGDIAPVGQRYRLGDVVYTLDEAVYKDGTVYGVGSIRAAEGANVVLIPEDYGVDLPAGYTLFMGEDEEIPEDAPSYAELAEQRGAKILLATCIANGVLNADGTLNASEIGYSCLPRADGSIQFTFEFSGGTVAVGNRLEPTLIERAPSYQVSLYLANWEVTSDGFWLREEPENTWLRTDWVVTVAPETKGE